MFSQLFSEDITPLIVLLPAIFCLVALFRGSVQKAVRDVFLPVFTLVPVYYYWKVPLLPPIDAAEAVLLPLGIALLIKERRRWRFSRADLWLLLFLISNFYPDLRAGDKTAAIFDIFETLCLAVIPYMIGKLAIEPRDGRVPFLKRFLILLFVSCCIGLYEWRMEINPFTLFFGRFFPNEHFAWKTQIRWGHGRVSGPFGQSELAGMMLFFGIVMALYLAYYHVWEPRFRIASWIPHKKSSVIAIGIFIALLLSQARGPWLGSLIAIPLSLVGRARRVGRAALIFCVITAVVAPVGYIGLQKYASGSGSAEQETANYRSRMLDNYIPIARAGGLAGWGKEFPKVWTQESIDNEYLFVALVQGYIGFFSLCFFALETILDLIVATVINPTRSDRYFAFSLLGCFLGILVTIFTVFLGNQPFQLFFLIAGWAQAVRLRPQRVPVPAFQRVYT